jgi:hypothetical protein
MALFERLLVTATWEQVDPEREFLMQVNAMEGDRCWRLLFLSIDAVVHPITMYPRG